MMKPLIVVCSAVLIAAPVFGAETKPKPAEAKPAAAAPKAPAAAPAATPTTEEEKTIYAVGLVLGRNVGALSLSAAELAILKRGFEDATSGAKPLVDLETYGPKIQGLAQARETARVEAEKAHAKAFLEAAAKEEGAVTTASGLVFRTLTPGTGESPAATDTVKVHYEGTLTDGTVFDSSVKRGQPAEMKLDGVIACWTEGVQKMKVGEKARLVCPSAIAYGDRGRPPVIPGGATLVFEVQLLEVKKAEAHPAASPAPTPPPSH